MWQKIIDRDYYLKFNHVHAHYEIYITDYISVWSANYTEKSFIAQSKYSNEGLELINDNEFVVKSLMLFTNLENLNHLSINQEQNGNCLSINLRRKLGFPYCFECRLSRGSNKFFFEKVTLPLLLTIQDLRSSQTELRRLLLKKDKEIDEYKSEGGEIVLRHLKTKAYDDEDHMCKFKKYEENFGSMDIHTCLIEHCDKAGKHDVKPKIIDYNMTLPKEKPTPSNSSIVQDQNNLKQEQITIKQEQNTPSAVDEPSPITTSVTCKQEVIKTEQPSSQTSMGSHRKRLRKLNY